MVVLKEHHKIKVGQCHITPIFKVLDVVLQKALLNNAIVSYLPQSTNGLWFWVWHH